MEKEKIVVSLATYSKRFDKLKSVIPCIIGQTLRFDVLLVNVQDDISVEDFKKFKDFEKLDDRISVKLRPAKWRSFNKFIHAYKEYQSCVIITVDDDIRYARWMLKALYDSYKINKDCIIAHELNPVDIDLANKKVINVMKSDLKLLQKCYNKYLTGCCLFPPKIFKGVESELENYEKFFKITQGTHDELWLWIHSTILGIKTIGLNYTWTFDMDGAFPPDKNSLCHKNGNINEVSAYDRRINESEYGKKIFDKVSNEPVVFKVTNDNLLSIIGNMQLLYSIYRNFNITFDCTDEKMQQSILRMLVSTVNIFKWYRNITFKTNICGEFGNGVERNPYKEKDETSKNKVALVCIAKDEEDYLEEWVDYHKKLGFDDVFVFQNDWRLKNDNVKRKVKLFERDGNMQQVEAYNWFIRNYHKNYGYAAFFDVDEFLSIDGYSNVKDFLKNYEDCNAIGINWRFFGNNGHKKVENGNKSVIGRFTKCSKNLDGRVKSIVNLNKCGDNVVFKVQPHNPVQRIGTNDKFTVNVGKTRYIKGAYNDNEKLSGVQINHYYCLSDEEFINHKVKRGEAMFPKSHPYGVKKYTEYFNNNNKNEVTDTTAYDFYFWKDEK